MDFDADHDHVVDSYSDLSSDISLLFPAFAEALDEIGYELGEDE